MRKTIFIMSLVLVILAITPLAISRAFVDTTTYATVYIQPGDTIWQIAAKYTTENADVREVVYEIRRINKLDNNARIYPGQVIKIPIKS